MWDCDTKLLIMKFFQGEGQLKNPTVKSEEIKILTLSMEASQASQESQRNDCILTKYKIESHLEASTVRLRGSRCDLRQYGSFQKTETASNARKGLDIKEFGNSQGKR